MTCGSEGREDWNTGMMGSWIGITLIEVGGASACGGLEAEGQEYFALCLSEALLNQKCRLRSGTTKSHGN